MRRRIAGYRACPAVGKSLLNSPYEFPQLGVNAQIRRFLNSGTVTILYSRGASSPMVSGSSKKMHSRW